jgi:hypothetical protein
MVKLLKEKKPLLCKWGFKRLEHMEGSLPRLDERKQVNAKPKSEDADVTRT